MRICIFGAGGVGGYLAANLARAGRNVCAVTRGAHLEAIRNYGLRLKTMEEEFVARFMATDDPRELGEQDLIVTTAKAPSLPNMIASMRPLMGKDTLIVFAVNGVFWFYRTGTVNVLSRLDPLGALRTVVDVGSALGMVVWCPTEVIRPGVVLNRGATRFVVGSSDPDATETLRLVESALSGAGFLFETTDNLARAMWTKLPRNLASSILTALTAHTSEETFSDRAVAEIGAQLMRETLTVAAATGHLLPEIDPIYESHKDRWPHQKPSMLQDLERSRLAELDAQLFAVQDLARGLQIKTPTLDLLLPIVAHKARLMHAYPG